MKTTYLLTFLLLFSSVLNAQVTIKADTIKPNKGDEKKQLEKIKENKVKLHDTLGNEPKKSRLVDTTVHNKYGDLLVDDTTYNKRYKFWKPAAEVVGIVGFTWSIDRFVLNADYARVGIKTWKYNIKTGWEWDIDRFGINFIGHPYSGSLTYNAGRSFGYNFYQSAAFSVGGSLMWEYFAENTRPSYNDIIYTPINGVFLGEVFYRLSSNILDDRTRGAERVFREIAAGLIDPIRGFNRLIQGKSFRKTNKEVYEKEPMNISLYGGAHRINEAERGTPAVIGFTPMVNIQLDYGNPFEIRSRKPFDFFKLRVDINTGQGRKIIDNILGYGVLFGKNYQLGKLAILAGGFQYYDFLG